MADKEKRIYKIRNSSDGYLEQILVWLKRESDENCGAGFYCNRRVIRKAHTDGSLIVMIIRGEVVAFSVVDQESWDILEVRPEYRRQGYGRKLAQHCINQFRKNGVCVLKIECVQNSNSFWEKMGFTICESDQDYAYLVFEHKNKLPDDLLISFEFESDNYNTLLAQANQKLYAIVNADDIARRRAIEEQERLKRETQA